MSYNHEYYKIDCNQDCPLWHSCNKNYTLKVWHQLKDKEEPVDILFLNAFSGMGEFSSRTPISGAAYNLMMDVIKKTDKPLSFIFTQAVRGWPIDMSSVPERFQKNLNGMDTYWMSKLKSKTFTEKDPAVYYCQKFWQNEINYFKPKKIVPMGNFPMKIMFPRETRAISNTLNETFKYGDYEVQTLMSPTMVLRSPSSKNSWSDHLHFLLTGEKKNELFKDVGKTTILGNLKEATQYIEFLKNHTGSVAIDTETANLNKKYGNVLGTVQFAIDDEEGVVLPYHHKDTPFDPNELEVVKSQLFDLFHTPNSIDYWICHNAKFECNILANTIGSQLLSADIFDAMIAMFLLDENRTSRSQDFKYGPYSLKQLSIDFLGFDRYDQGIMQVRDEGSLIDLALNQLAEYGAMDAYNTYALKDAFEAEAVKQDYLPQLTKLMRHFYTPVTRLFSDVERTGSYVNRHYLRSLLRRDSPIVKEINSIEASLKNYPEVQQANEMVVFKNYDNTTVVPLGGTPWEYSFAKKEHPQKLFFDVLKLKPTKVGKSGVPSVDTTWQEVNKGAHELVDKYIEWVEYRKMMDAFVDKLYKRVDPQSDNPDCNTDSKIRPNYKLSSVVTGRMACSDPNLQAIPRADSPAKLAVKNIFQAMPGHVMIQADYRAAEMRLVAVVAQEDNLFKAFNEGKRYWDKYRENPDSETKRLAQLYGDIHRQNAAKAFKVAVEDVTKNQRQAAKGCLAKGTLTPTKKGILPIEEVKIGDEVWTGTQWSKVEDYYRPKSKIYRIETERGYHFDVSHDHEIQVFDSKDLSLKFVELKDLSLDKHYIPIRRNDCFDFEEVSVDYRMPEPVTPSDFGCIANSRKNDTFPSRFPSKVDEDLAFLLGAMTAEGGHSVEDKNATSFSQKKCDQYLEHFKMLYSKLFGVDTVSRQNKTTGTKVETLSAYSSRFLGSVGHKRGAYNKVVPWSIFRSPKKVQAAFLRGYMSGDGSAPKTGLRNVKCSSASEELIKGLQQLLLNFGIVSSYSTSNQKLPKKEERRLYHYLTITGPDYEKYFDKIGSSFNIEYRQRQGERHQKDFVPGYIDFLRSVKKQVKSSFNIHDNNHVLKEMSWVELKLHWGRHKEFLFENGFQELVQFFEEKLFKVEPFFAKIKSIECIRDQEEEVYDLVLPEPETWFLAGGAIQFDCTFGVLYDSSAKGIADVYGMSVEEATQMMDDFYVENPNILKWKTDMKTDAKTKSYVETPHGRRRRFPIFDLFRDHHGMFDSKYVPREYMSKVEDALRQSSNAPIQGIASDCMMVGAALLAEHVRESKVDRWFIQNAVHDSTILQVPISDIREAVQTVEEFLTNRVQKHFTKYWGINFNLTLEIDLEIGKKWGELEGWDFDPGSLEEIIAKMEKLDEEDWGDCKGKKYESDEIQKV